MLETVGSLTPSRSSATSLFSSDEHDLSLSESLSLHDVADLLQIEEVDSAAVANTADINVVVASLIVDASALVL